jgi:hypothetical protein
VEAFAFKAAAIEGLVAFRIPEPRASIFVGPELVARAHEAKLTGVTFKEIWPVN